VSDNTTHRGCGDRRTARSFAAAVRRNWPVARFLLAVAAALLGIYHVLHLGWISGRFVAPYTGFVAACSRAFLRMLGVSAGGAGEVIVSPQFGVTIKNVCNGLEVMAIYFAAVLAFPAAWKHKLLGLAIGFPVIFAVNIVRVAALFVLGYKVPHVFETAHYYYAQAFVIIATAAVWLAWVTTYSAYGSKTRHRVPD
jgi:exosortase H (IPTLxxWG-CTERM-specific)